MTLVSERVGQFFHDDHRLEYTEYGGGERWVVLLHGPLLPRRMHEPLARRLAGAGLHVVTLDLLGHGRSDRPADPTAYSTGAFAEQVVDLLDHLGASAAVLGGASLGANVALEVAVTAPDRVLGLLLETPALDNGVEAGILLFAPLLLVSRFAPLAVHGARTLSRLVPRRLVPFWVGIGLDSFDQRPAAMAATVHGLLFGRMAPSAKERRRIDAPVLVVGRPRDPVHPAADAAMLADEVVGARFVSARGFLEWRVRPDRLDAEALAFTTACFEEPARGRLVGS